MYLLCRPQNQVHAGAGKYTRTDIYPKHGFHNLEKPRAGVRNSILADGDEDGGHGHHDCRDEE